MTAYVYRREEMISREPTAPYVFREPSAAPRKLPSRKDYKPERCGKTSGYRQHHRYGEPVCERCAAAQSEYAHGYRTKGKEE